MWMWTRDDAPRQCANVSVAMKDRIGAVIGSLLVAGIIGLVALYGQAQRHEAILAGIKQRLAEVQLDVRAIRESAHTHGPSTRMYLPDAEPGPVQ